MSKRSIYKELIAKYVYGKQMTLHEAIIILTMMASSQDIDPDFKGDLTSCIFKISRGFPIEALADLSRSRAVMTLSGEEIMANSLGDASDLLFTALISSCRCKDELEAIRSALSIFAQDPKLDVLLIARNAFLELK